MAGKKFTIPSLSEMENSKREEYKVKTLFDKHKSNLASISPKKQTDENGEAKNVGGPNVASATGSSNTQTAGLSRKRTSNESQPKSSKLSVSNATGQGDQTKVQIATKPCLIVTSKTVDSQKASPQKTGQLSAIGGPAKGVNLPTGISPTRPSKTPSLIVSAKQRGNPLLKHVRSVPWEFGDVVADYEMGTVMCALFLSLRYHNLNPNYIHERLKLLGHSYDLRVLLVQVDTKDPHHTLRELAKICILADCTLICAWSPEEAARYLETYKVFERKPPDMIMEKQEVDFVSRAQEVLTSGRKINRTDVVTLLSTFGSFENVVRAGEEEMSFCPGLGIHKAKRLHRLLHEPFLKAKKRKRVEEVTDDKGTEASVKE